uniref:Uncharacterized protein n=1 Tax=Anguilla anguilla TaxID=7936 RepID=A0A0E9XHL1_ANGAN
MQTNDQAANERYYSFFVFRVCVYSPHQKLYLTLES